MSGSTPRLMQFVVSRTHFPRNDEIISTPFPRGALRTRFDLFPIGFQQIAHLIV